MDEFIKAHTYSRNNSSILDNNQLCGCFYCIKTFTANKIKDWIIEPDDSKTAICPYCGIDSVIGENTGFEITEVFLQKMHKYWF